MDEKESGGREGRGKYELQVNEEENKAGDNGDPRTAREVNKGGTPERKKKGVENRSLESTEDQLREWTRMTTKAK